MQIYDDALPIELFDEIKKIVFSYDFPWFWCRTAYTGQIELTNFGYSFAHLAMIQGQNNSSICNLLVYAIKELAKKSNQEIAELWRIRIGLISAMQDVVIHPAHVDFEAPHRTGLIYLNDSDGDTTIYDQKFDPNSELNDYEQYMSFKDKLTIKESITPKANRFAWFDGLHYHNSSTPKTTERRIVINFNYKEVQ